MERPGPHLRLAQLPQQGRCTRRRSLVPQRSPRLSTKAKSHRFLCYSAQLQPIVAVVAKGTQIRACLRRFIHLRCQRYQRSISRLTSFRCISHGSSSITHILDIRPGNTSRRDIPAQQGHSVGQTSDYHLQFRQWRRWQARLAKALARRSLCFP